MSYQGMRAREADDESTRVFAVSKVRLAAQGQVSHVLWAEVNTRTDHDVSTRAVAPVAEVIDAMHGGARVAAMFPHQGGRRPERFFAVKQHEDGSEAIALDGAPSPGRELRDIDALDTLDGVAQAPAAPPVKAARAGRRQAQTFAVSSVELDADGRVVAVRWGRVDTLKNAWASDERTARVGDVVLALRAGHAVFALFASAHGHLPERRFVAVDYDDGRQAIVLDGPATHEREIHDMDRLGTGSVR